MGFNSALKGLSQLSRYYAISHHASHIHGCVVLKNRFWRRVLYGWSEF